MRRITTNIFNSRMWLVRQCLHGFINPRPPLNSLNIIMLTIHTHIYIHIYIYIYIYTYSYVDEFSIEFIIMSMYVAI